MAGLVEWVNRDAVARGVEPTVERTVGLSGERRTRPRKRWQGGLESRRASLVSLGQDTEGAASWTELCWLGSFWTLGDVKL